MVPCMSTPDREGGIITHHSTFQTRVPRDQVPNPRLTCLNTAIHDSSVTIQTSPSQPHLGNMMTVLTTRDLGQVR